MNTIIQTARKAGNLMAFWDFRGGNEEDQSGNGHVLTVPSDASLSRQGLRCRSTAATIDLDLSGTQNICVFALVQAAQVQSTNEQLLWQHNTTWNGAGAFNLYQNANTYLTAMATGSSGQSQANFDAVYRTDSYFFSAHIDKRLSYEMIKLYNRGILDTNNTVDNNTNDGSGFADSITYLLNNNVGSQPHKGLLQAFGILDFTDSDDQLSATQQAQLYTEIRDLKTI